MKVNKLKIKIMKKDFKLITAEYLEEHGYKLLKDSDKYATFYQVRKTVRYLSR